MNVAEIKGNALVEYWLGHKDALDLLVKEWHEGNVGSELELHEFLGLTLEEYSYVFNSDYFDHENDYIDFMDYLIRNAIEN